MTDTLIRAETPELKGKRVLLRALRLSDSGPMSLYAGDERVAAMTSTIPHPYPPGAAESFIEATLAGRRDETTWGIDASPDDGAEFVGVIGVRKDSHELGYWVGPPFWGTGYASEACALVCEHFFAAGLERMSAEVFFDNPASARVLTRNGFEKSGEGWAYSVARGMEVPVLRFERRT